MVDLAEDMRTDFAVVPHQAVSSQGKAATAQQAMAAGQPAAAAADEVPKQPHRAAAAAKGRSKKAAKVGIYALKCTQQSLFLTL